MVVLLSYFPNEVVFKYVVHRNDMIESKVSMKPQMELTYLCVNPPLMDIINTTLLVCLSSFQRHCKYTKKN